MSKVLTAIFSISYTLVRWTHVALGSETELPLAFCSTWVSFSHQRQDTVGVRWGGSGGGQKGQEGVVDAQDKKGKALPGSLVVRAWENGMPLPQHASFHPTSPTHRPSLATRHWPQACCVFFYPLRLHMSWSADWHHVLKLIVGHCPAQAMQKAQSAAHWARTQSREHCFLGGQPWSTGSDVCYCPCFLLQNRWSRNAGCNTCRGMKRHNLNDIFLIMCLGLAQILARRETLVWEAQFVSLSLYLCCIRFQKTVCFYGVIKRYSLDKPYADLT